jgi:integrase
MRRNPHVRFGGRAEETDRPKGPHRASARSNHTHGTLLIKAGVPVKVVSERLGHATPAFTIDTYQHVLPGMQADAARVFEQLIAPALPPAPTGRERGPG